MPFLTLESYQSYQKPELRIHPPVIRDALWRNRSKFLRHSAYQPLRILTRRMPLRASRFGRCSADRYRRAIAAWLHFGLRDCSLALGFRPH